ncbi:MAG: hypothetical protein E7L17_04450 [Clostridium sp.]|uniref:hypothetical protein n=1 Tax=Clostridium sp. TaxID=1506 RepID=UPI002907CED9|nr:hypothetical protein [Clostridium sp.]MDU7337346.1 hypothetical protein [Clostridium sp.]
MEKTKKRILIGVLTISVAAAAAFGGTKLLIKPADYILDNRSIVNQGVMFDSVDHDNDTETATGLSLGKDTYRVIVKDDTMIVQNRDNDEVISVNQQQEDNTYVLELKKQQRIQVTFDSTRNMLKLAGASAK